MKFVRLFTGLLASRSGFNPNFYCTKAMPRRRDTAPLEASRTELFRRISPVGDLNMMVPILDQWVEEGRYLDKSSLIDVMKKLLRFNRFGLALEISKWMDCKRYFKLDSVDVAFRLYLISKVEGVDEAEKCFDNLSQNLKCLPVYGSLLKCYADASCVEKAEAVMLKIRNLGGYQPQNDAVMLNLYRKTGNMEKFDALLREMEESGMNRTNRALGIQLSACADAKDVEGMDKIVSILESDPKVVPNWVTYSAAAAGYTKLGLSDKALQMLKKAEARVTSGEYRGYNFLLSQYGILGRKDEVWRLWSLYKQKCKVYNNGYRYVLRTLVKLGDFEMAEEIFHEWESQSQGLTYDMCIPNIMIAAYSRNGLIGKAEAVLNNAISKGGKPYAWTWHHMYVGYILNEQYEKAVEMMKKVIADSRTRRKPVPTVESIKACLEYLKGTGDTEQTEEFAELLDDRDDVNSLDQQEESCGEEEDRSN